MKSTTYRITLSDKRIVQELAHSVAEAIEACRRKYLGRRVVECYSGMKQRDVDFVRSIDSRAMPAMGWVTHDIPKHKAHAAGTTFPSTRRSLTDETVPMFDEKEIARQSRKARDRG